MKVLILGGDGFAAGLRRFISQIKDTISSLLIICRDAISITSCQFPANTYCDYF